MPAPHETDDDAWFDAIMAEYHGYDPRPPGVVVVRVDHDEPDIEVRFIPGQRKEE